jgi:hypothetical protein
MAFLILLCLSLVFLGFGIYRLKGPISVWYLAYGVALVEINYFAIPVGIGLGIWSLAMSPLISDEWKLVVLNIGTFSGILGIIPARHLKPKWLKWLEREHGKMMPLIRKEIEKTGYQNWDRLINKQDDLEQWIADIQRKQR